MGHSTVQLRAGVSTTATPALNEAGVSQSQLIRYFIDPTLGVLIQKIGGWVRAFANTFPSIVRALWAWEDTNGVQHLAVGCENVGSTDAGRLFVITNGTSLNITPTFNTTNVTPSFATSTGSPIVAVTDSAEMGITEFDTVYIETHVSVGGLILFGLYPCISFSASEYKIQALDVLGNPENATATVTSGGALAAFTTTASSATVTVNLPNHGYEVGSTYPCLVATTVGGVTIYGNYLVASVVDANNFTILGGNVASASATGTINGGHVRSVYSFGVGAIPLGSGFGIGGFGRGGFGVGPGVVPATGPMIPATDWITDNWGEVLIACPINGTIFQPIYQYDPLSGEPMATIIPQAPPLNDGVFVAMPQRQLVAWGTTETGIQDPLLIRWCDVANYNDWIATVQNQAGDFRIPRGSRIVAGMQAPQQGLIWTDLGVWSMQYVGPDIVYSFNELGNGCGLIARKAAGVLGGVVYWMGPSQFYLLAGEGVQPLPCSVWDVVFQNLDQSNLQKIRCAPNSRFNEISWFFPSLSGGGEVDMYVKFNVVAQAWDYGMLPRSAWIDQSVLGPPIGSDPTTLYVYQHETTNNADGQAMLPSFRTGYYTIGDGDLMTFVDQIWPDMKWGEFGQANNATVMITFWIANYPGDTPRQIGPYSVTQATRFISPRFRARLVALELSSSDVNSFWRIGATKYRWVGEGKF